MSFYQSKLMNCLFTASALVWFVTYRNSGAVRAAILLDKKDSCSGCNRCRFTEPDIYNKSEHSADRWDSSEVRALSARRSQQLRILSRCLSLLAALVTPWRYVSWVSSSWHFTRNLRLFQEFLRNHPPIDCLRTLVWGDALLWHETNVSRESSELV